MGTLIVEAYESSFQMAKSAEYLDIENSQLVYKTHLYFDNKETHIIAPAYNLTTNFVDIHNVPPPPMVVTPDDGRTDILYTIVPGQISSAAERRGVNPRIIYGEPGLYSSDLEPEEEWELEKSYYYKPFDDDSSDDSSGDSSGDSSDDSSGDSSDDSSDDEGGTQMSSSKHLHLPPL